MGRTVTQAVRRTAIAAVAALALSTGSLAVAQPAGAAGALRFTGCLGSVAGCTSSPSKLVEGARRIVATNNAVYMATHTGIVQLFAGSGLSYGGCVSSDGSGGACADTPGTQQTVAEAEAVSVNPAGTSLYTGAWNPDTFSSPRGVVSRLSIANPGGQIAWQQCWSDDGSEKLCQDALGPAEGRPLHEPVALASSPDGRSLFAVSENSVVSHFFTNPLTGEMSFDGCVGRAGSLEDQSCAQVPGPALGHLEDVAVSAADQVYVLGTAPDTVSHLRTDPEGRLTYEGCIAAEGLSGSCASFPGKANPIFHADAMAWAPNGSLYVAAEAGILTRLALDPEGRIAFGACWAPSTVPCESAPLAVSVLEDPQGIAISADGRTLYLATLHALLAYSLDAGGKPSLLQCFSAEPVAGCEAVPGAALDSFKNVSVSPDGTAVYVSGSGYVARFSTSATAGGGPNPPGSPGTATGGGGKKPLCGGHRATIVGTAHAEHIKGTKNADVIVGLGGNDTIEGGGGNDIICGGPGKDKLRGGAGNDRLYGEGGNDTLSGEKGADALFGGAGDDKLEGGAGNDRLLGQAGADKLLGGPGNDRLEGGAGRDRLGGGPGHNTLHS